MFKLFIAVVFFILIIWITIDVIYLSKPPKPEVVWNSIKIPTTISSNCWKGSFQGSCVDYVYESAWEMGLKKGTVKVEPNATIKINFNKRPNKGSLKVAEVYEDGEEENVIMEDNNLYAPIKQGIYVYMIYANWEQGNPSYGFAIKVE